MTANANATATAAAPAARPTRPSRRRAARIAGGMLLPLAVLAVWQAVTASGLVPPYRLPPPAAVVEAAVQLAESGQLWLHVAISVQRILLGFAIGSVAGLLVAAVVGLTRIGDVVLTPSLAALRAIPSLALVPLLVLWMGIGEDSKVTLIAIGAFFPVFTTVSPALRYVDPHLVEMGRTFGLRGGALLRAVQLPAVVPAVVSGLRLALAQSWLFLVAAELVAAAMGLGFLLTDSQGTGRVDRILLAIVLLAVLGAASNGLVSVAERRLLARWT
ncbi:MULTISPECIES: ABC transporter permease [Microbacterium]|uniref:ABC transporter permease n=1 Tax=Microbacterium wangchenii TaxID=2541726 RepID=A0ABX5SV80_9MICO|nr:MULTISPECIES: ABC transporter permease [Microbacterium]MCK6065297.1 ABC transporter permease [Microbacterium sp. EYE_512]QBR88744.1 ABC transporter permease [Microbacterium wangchenii]